MFYLSSSIHVRQQSERFIHFQLTQDMMIFRIYIYTFSVRKYLIPSVNLFFFFFSVTIKNNLTTSKKKGKRGKIFALVILCFVKQAKTHTIRF